MYIEERTICPACQQRTLPTFPPSALASACQNPACRTIFNREQQPIGSYSDAGIHLVEESSAKV